MGFEKRLNEVLGSGGTPSSDEIAERIVDACDKVSESGKLLTPLGGELPTRRIQVEGLPLAVDLSSNDPESEQNTYILNWTGPESAVSHFAIGGAEEGEGMATVGTIEDGYNDIKKILDSGLYTAIVQFLSGGR